METNPYLAPTAYVADVERAVLVDGAVFRDIRNAWIAAVISGTISLIVVMVSVSYVQVLGIDAWDFFDVALIFGLAYGVYRRSRVCAVLLLVHFICARWYMLQHGASLSGLSLVFALMFVYFYFRGVIGTFRYQKAMRRG